MAGCFLNANQDYGLPTGCVSGKRIPIASPAAEQPANTYTGLLRVYGMAPEVLLRKLSTIRQLLHDLEPYRQASFDAVVAEHYKLERLLELLVMVASDVLNHLLGEQGITPNSYRATFRLAGRHGLLPEALATRLQEAASMRNVLVHLYEDIDYHILHRSIPLALQDFAAFIVALETHLGE
jgi:uncharacterized protein YutE (UPF0331/DUF86 family)